MPEPGNGDLPPKQPEKIPDDQPKEQTTREAFLGQIRTSEEAEKAWRDLYKEQGIDFDKLSVDERGIVDVAIRQGTIPGKASVEKVAGFLKEASRHPEFTEKLRDMAASIPEQEAVTRRREEAGEEIGGIRIKAQLEEERQLLANLRAEITISKLQIIASQILASPETIETQYRLLEDIHKDEFKSLNERIATAGTDEERQKIMEELTTFNREFYRLNEAAGQMLPKKEKPANAELIERMRELDSFKKGSKDRNTRIRDLLDFYVRENSPEDHPVYQVIMDLIAEDTVASEKFITGLVVLPVEGEAWSPKGLYTRGNLDRFIRTVQGQEGKISGEKAERLRNLVEASESFHNMNYIIRKNFDQYGQQSESIQPQHLQEVSSVAGVSKVFSLYERIYAQTLGEEARITEALFFEIDRKVEEALHGDRKNIKGLAGRGLQDWELERAFIYGRNLFRITVRSGELISLSDLQKGGDPGLYVSSPQKNFAQLLNVLKFVGVRFEVEKFLGGPELLNGTIKRMRKARIKRGVRLKTVQGTDIGMRELQNIVAARGVFATWRNAEAILSKIRFFEPDGRETSITRFFEEHKNQIEGLKVRLKSKNSGKAAAARANLENLFGPLLENTNIALGVLVSPSGISVPTEIKEMVWKKISQVNPVIMSTILSRLETENPDLQFIQNGETGPKIESLEDTLLKIWGTDEQKKAVWGTGNLKKRDITAIPIEELGIREIKILLEKNIEKLNNFKASKTSEDRPDVISLRESIDKLNLEYEAKQRVLRDVFADKKWVALRDKLDMANYKRVEKEKDRLTNRPHEKPEIFDIGALGLSAPEIAVVSSIIKNGEDISKDLANIKQVQAWFLNDVPIEMADWISLGQFYDRATADLANFNKSGSALLKVISNPFGVPPKDIGATFKESIDAVSMVLGRDAGVENQDPMIREFFSMIYTRPSDRQSILKLGKETFKKATSRAQEIIGVKGASFNEDKMQALFDEFLPLGIIKKTSIDEDGILSEGNYDDIRKEFRTKWNSILWGKIRDYGPIGLLAFLLQFFQSLSKEKLS